MHRHAVCMFISKPLIIISKPYNQNKKPDVAIVVFVKKYIVIDCLFSAHYLLKANLFRIIFKTGMM